MSNIQRMFATKPIKPNGRYVKGYRKGRGHIPVMAKYPVLLQQQVTTDYLTAGVIVQAVEGIVFVTVCEIREREPRLIEKLIPSLEPEVSYEFVPVERYQRSYASNNFEGYAQKAVLEYEEKKRIEVESRTPNNICFSEPPKSDKYHKWNTSNSRRVGI